MKQPLKSIMKEVRPIWDVSGDLWCVEFGSARGVMVIVAGYGHGDRSSNPGPDWLHFT